MYHFEIEVEQNFINVISACNVIHVLRRLLALLLFHNGVETAKGRLFKGSNFNKHAVA